MKLHDLTNEHLLLMDQLTENGGLLTPELEATLERIDDNVTLKTGGYVRIIRSLQTQAAVCNGQADGIELEVTRLRKLARSREKAAESLSRWLKKNLEAMGRTVVETDIAVVRVQRNGGRPGIDFVGDVNELPEEFRNVLVTPNTDAAYQAHKANRELPPGFVVHPRGTRLVIQ